MWNRVSDWELYLAAGAGIDVVHVISVRELVEEPDSDEISWACYERAIRYTIGILPLKKAC